jgi:hypothetical protein
LSDRLRRRLTAKEINMTASISRMKPANSTTGDDDLSTCLKMRPRLFGIAERMLGRTAEGG